MSKNVLSSIREQVQYNCHITDATYAGQYTLCVYLLKMREFFRWEIGQEFNSIIDKEKLGQWIVERESLWLDIEEQPYKSLEIDTECYDPFDTKAINVHLENYGLVYSAGYGNRLRPHFFLAEMEQSHAEEDYTIYVTGREYARDLTAPPAMAQGDVIFLRRESFRRMIWEKYEEWLWNKPDNAMKRAIAHYPFTTSPLKALEEMTTNELNMALLHEIGEVKASAILGEQWREVLSQLSRSKGEIMLRAVKDHLADSLSTLPELIADFRPESFHFYMANLTSMRKTIAPGLTECYESWWRSNITDSTPDFLQSYIKQAKSHWLKLAQKILELRDRYADNKIYSLKVAQIIEQSYL